MTKQKEKKVAKMVDVLGGTLGKSIHRKGPTAFTNRIDVWMEHMDKKLENNAIGDKALKNNALEH